MAGQNSAGTSPISMKAGAAITQNAVVKISAANTVIVTTAITENVFGVAATAATAADQSVEVWTVPGTVVKMIASAAISVGAEVMPGASGKVATAAGATALSCGVAMEAAGADGDIIEVLFRPSVKCPANS